LSNPLAVYYNLLRKLTTTRVAATADSAKGRSTGSGPTEILSNSSNARLESCLAPPSILLFQIFNFPFVRLQGLKRSGGSLIAPQSGKAIFRALHSKRFPVAQGCELLYQCCFAHVGSLRPGHLFAVRVGDALPQGDSVEGAPLRFDAPRVHRVSPGLWIGTIPAISRVDVRSSGWGQSRVLCLASSPNRNFGIPKIPPAPCSRADPGAIRTSG
jgi:hypothetical protein